MTEIRTALIEYADLELAWVDHLFGNGYPPLGDDYLPVPLEIPLCSAVDETVAGFRPVGVLYRRADELTDHDHQVVVAYLRAVIQYHKTEIWCLKEMLQALAAD